MSKTARGGGIFYFVIHIKLGRGHHWNRERVLSVRGQANSCKQAEGGSRLGQTTCDNLNTQSGPSSRGRTLRFGRWRFYFVFSLSAALFVAHRYHPGTLLSIFYCVFPSFWADWLKSQKNPKCRFKKITHTQHRIMFWSYVSIAWFGWKWVRGETWYLIRISNHIVTNKPIKSEKIMNQKFKNA